MSNLSHEGSVSKEDIEKNLKGFLFDLIQRTLSWAFVWKWPSLFYLNIERHWPFSDPWLVVAKANPSPSYLNKFKKLKSKDLKEKNFVTKSIADLICFWWMIRRFPPENCDRSYDGADTSVLRACK